MLKFFENIKVYNKAFQVEPSTASPGKSILSKKNGHKESVPEEVKKTTDVNSSVSHEKALNSRSKSNKLKVQVKLSRLARDTRIFFFWLLSPGF